MAAGLLCPSLACPGRYVGSSSRGKLSSFAEEQDVASGNGVEVPGREQPAGGQRSPYSWRFFRRPPEPKMQSVSSTELKIS